LTEPTIAVYQLQLRYRRTVGGGRVCQLGVDGQAVGRLYQCRFQIMDTGMRCKNG